MIRCLSLCLTVICGSVSAQSFPTAFPEQANAPRVESVPVQVGTLARGLEHPWGIVQLPDGRFLVTERPGRLRIVGTDGSISAPLFGVPEVLAQRQGGLLDVALAPDFAQSRRVFLTYSKPLGGGFSATAAAHGRLAEDGSGLLDVVEFWVMDPPSRTPMHYGSRIIPMRDGTVFITTGERSSRQERVLAQDLNTTYGKVVRVRVNGRAAPGNPFIGQAGRDDIWSFGHRNIQSAALDADGTLWTIEHGPRGGDELNRPEPGKNYGWPIVSYGINYNGSPVGTGAQSGAGFEEPVYFWTPVIAPGGMIFHSGNNVPEWQGDIFVGGLRAGALVRLELEGGLVVAEERLAQGIGRVRDVVEMSDGRLAILIDAAGGRVDILTPAR